MRPSCILDTIISPLVLSQPTAQLCDYPPVTLSLIALSIALVPVIPLINTPLKTELVSNTREIARVRVRVKRKYLSGCISMGDSCGDFLSIYLLFLSIKCVEMFVLLDM